VEGDDKQRMAKTQKLVFSAELRGQKVNLVCPSVQQVLV